jgi:hypothetical protein
LLKEAGFDVFVEDTCKPSGERGSFWEPGCVEAIEIAATVPHAPSLAPTTAAQIFEKVARGRNKLTNVRSQFDP